jgi:3-hydroxy-9,10-secoandrosta-1,3,5(10)-triene-9,17-dione monooxygenase
MSEPYRVDEPARTSAVAAGVVGDASGAGDLRAELIARARSLVPLLARNAATTEADRRIAEDNIAALQAAGFFKLMVPRRFGGLETELRAQIDVTRELAMGCGSTAWVTSLMNTCAWITGLASDRAQQDVWGADPDARIAGVLSPKAQVRRADGGFLVAGRWSWASGCLHAHWGLVGLPVPADSSGAIEPCLGLIPMADLSIEDTWFAAGMRGTGSHTLVADGAFVPDHRILSLGKLLAGEAPAPHRDEALYRCSFAPVTSLALVAPQLGLAAAALAFVIERAPQRGISFTTYDVQAAAPTVQTAVAEAATLIDTAHLHAYRATTEIEDAARAGRTLDHLERARIRMDTGHIARTAREAIRSLCSAYGAASFVDSCPLQRIWRDSEVASRHALVNPEIGAEIYGRALLGITDSVTALG